MRLTESQLAGYQDIYFRTFGERISKDDALVQGMALLRVIKVLAKNSDGNENEPREAEDHS